MVGWTKNTGWVASVEMDIGLRWPVGSSIAFRGHRQSQALHNPNGKQFVRCSDCFAAQTSGKLPVVVAERRLWKSLPSWWSGPRPTQGTCNTRNHIMSIIVSYWTCHSFFETVEVNTATFRIANRGIYHFMCVCVCVCVCMETGVDNRKAKEK